MRACPNRAAAVAASVLLLVASACSRSDESTGAAAGGGAPVGGQPGGESSDQQATTTTTTFVPRRFTIGATGDILVHAPVMRSATAYAGGKGYDFNPMFDDVRDMISGVDLAICHQETPISADGKNLTVPNTLSFNAPKEIAPALKAAGFEGCDTASNHTYDRQLSGVIQTLDMLDAAGLKHAGSTRSAADADSAPIYDVKGVKVGHLAYSYTIYNNAGPSLQVPPDAPWLKSMLWPAVGKDGILADAAKLKAKGADVVLVSMHWGDQYISKPNAQQQQLAADLLASPDVDLILGDHVHVVQPCQKINDKYVIYGMGNFLSNQSPTQDRSLKVENQDGSWYQWEFAETSPKVFKAQSMQFAPTWVVTQGHKVSRATPDKFGQSHDRTVKVMGSLGPLGACDAKPMY